MLTAAECVNRIQECFGKCKYLYVGPLSVQVQIGPRQYAVTWKEAFKVQEALDDGNVRRLQSSDFAQWHQDILNGKRRNDAGEMVEVQHANA